MRNSRLILFSLAIIFNLPLLLKGQSNDMRSISTAEKFNRFFRLNRFEDIFIHSDRDTYVAGEEMFIKAYLFSRDSLVLSGTSSFAYVELISPLGIPVAQIKVLLENGKGNSALTIPDTVMNGNYMLRAYTSRMKNHMPYGCFMKSIAIINPFSNHYINAGYSRTGSKTGTSVITFWPEGGKIMAGAMSRIGIFSADSFGRPAPFRGSILNSTGKTVATLSTDSSGIGVCEFVPEKGMTYTAVSVTGKERFELPPVASGGIAIRVISQSADTIRILLTPGESNEAEYAFAEVLIRSLGKILFNKREYLGDRPKLITIPLTMNEPGIVDIAVFDGTGKPAAERFLFLSEAVPREKTEPELALGKREKAKIEIIPAQFPENLDLNGMSIGISPQTAGGKVLTMNEHLIFGSEYRIENIAFDIATFISGLPCEKHDIVMLGLKDNLADWNKIMTTKALKPEFADETGEQILVLAGSRSALRDEDIYKPAFMTSPGKTAEFCYSFRDEQNRYTFFIGKENREKDIVIQLPDSVNSYGFKIESSFYQGYISSYFVPDTSMPLIPGSAAVMARNFQVMKIFGIPVSLPGEKAKTAINSKPAFYGKPDQELIMKNYISLPAMQEVFFELIPGVSVRTTNKKVKFNIIDPFSNTILDGEPLLLIDGVRIDDPSIILNLNPEKVEKIDIVTSEYLVGDLIFPGIINVITKAGDLTDIPLPVNSLRIKYRLYDPPSEFLSPDYPAAGYGNERIPDFRNTLYWSYNLKNTAGAKTLIEFQTSDIASDYIITVAGTDRSGRPVSFRKSFSVR
jgi:hypothetical protein